MKKPWIIMMISVALVACGGGSHVDERRVAPSLAAAPAPDVDLSQRVLGVVEVSKGAPAAGAVVALNGMEGEALVMGIADAQGRFDVARPSERFGMTVMSADGVAAFLSPADAAAKTTLRVRLGPLTDAFTITGRLSVLPGPMPSDARMRAIRISEDEGDIFHASVSPSGEFVFRVPAGLYAINPSKQHLARWIRVKGGAGDRKNVAVVASPLAPAPEAVVRWMSETAMPIATTDVTAETDDIASLATVLAKARVIGLGEATHGTREYFRLKHRLLQRLVTHHGVTLLAMEANFSDAERVDAWVRTGKGTVEDAMKGLFVVWRTEEVRALLEWMRKWNTDPSHDKIGFRGYDVQGTKTSVGKVRAYIRKVDPRAEKELIDPMAPLDAETKQGVIELQPAELIAMRDAIAKLKERLVSARSRYVARSGEAEYAIVMQHTRALEQARARYAAKGNAARFTARDRAMAENVMWLSEQLPKDERVMVWAHNGHIQVDASTLLGRNMGTILRERLGEDYVAAGFVLGEGTYRAWVKPNKPDLADVAIGPPQDGWVAEAFGRVGSPMFAVDLRGPKPKLANDWLSAPHIVHSCGWLVNKHELKGTVDVVRNLFDVAIYVDQTSSARQLPRGQK